MNRDCARQFFDRAELLPDRVLSQSVGRISLSFIHQELLLITIIPTCISFNLRHRHCSPRAQVDAILQVLLDN